MKTNYRMRKHDFALMDFWFSITWWFGQFIILWFIFLRFFMPKKLSWCNIRMMGNEQTQKFSSNRNYFPNEMARYRVGAWWGCYTVCEIFIYYVSSESTCKSAQSPKRMTRVFQALYFCHVTIYVKIYISRTGGM